MHKAYQKDEQFVGSCTQFVMVVTTLACAFESNSKFTEERQVSEKCQAAV